MNFPIPVNMTVDSGEAIQMTVQGDVTVSCVVDICISPNVQETYDGPYSVTPTESVQTLETAEKAMTDDVTVGAIPADYIGSSVPRKTSADLTASGPTVTAPAGYYASAASKSVSSGSASTPNTSITADVDVLLSANGLITATASGSQSLTPNVVEGYVGIGTAGTVSVDGLKNVQLPTQAAKTVTPTESEQTAVAAQKFTTGEVKVAAIPSDYIGSAVPTQAAQTITPTESEQTAVAAGKYTTGIVKVSGIPSDYVGSTVTRKAAGAYTPSSVAQEISAGQYLEGAQTIEAVAPPYYDMSGANAWLGADATLVNTFTLADVKLSATNFASWTPSTTATDILATRTAGTFTASNMPDYDYYICWETVIPIEYQAGAVDKAMGIYLAAYHVQAIVRRASSYANYQAGNANSNVNVSAFTGGNFYCYYGSTQGTITYTSSASYGFYGTVTANTISSTTAASPTITLKTPKVTARCSKTYLSTSNASLIDQDKTVIKQKCRVYRVKKASFMQGVWLEVMRLMQEVDPS